MRAVGETERESLAILENQVAWPGQIVLQHNEQQVPEVLQQEGQERMQMSWQENCIHCCRGFWVPVSAPGCKFAMLPCCKLPVAVSGCQLRATKLV